MKMCARIIIMSGISSKMSSNKGFTPMEQTMKLTPKKLAVVTVNNTVKSRTL